MPAVGALPPLIAPPEELARIQGMRGLGQRLGTIVGPSAGGLAVSVGGPAGAFAAAGLVFAVSVVLLLLLKVRRVHPQAEAGPAQSPWQDLLDGLRYVRRHWLLVPLMTVTAGEPGPGEPGPGEPGPGAAGYRQAAGILIGWLLKELQSRVQEHGPQRTWVVWFG
jgi:MFS family permease